MRTLFLTIVFWALAFSVTAGNRHFQAGDYDRAAVEYRRALEQGNDSPELRYNLGTALLRLQRYEEARPHLETAARSGDAELSQRASYNLGNTHLEPAFGAPPSAERMAELRTAVAWYRQALRLDPGDIDAKWNLELAERLLNQQSPSPQPQQGGGGGGGESPDQQATARPDPSPAPTGDGSDAPMSQAEAERVLQQAEEVEREVQRERLRRTQAPPPNVRDW